MRIAGVADKNVASLASAVELAAEPGTVRRIGARMDIGMKRAGATSECVANLVDGCGSRQAELRTGFVKGHATAVR